VLAVLALTALAGCGGGGGKDAPHGASLYVSADKARCDDGRSAAKAATADTPLCSIERALHIGPAGGTVIVAPGRYPEVTADDHPAQPITVRAARAGTVRVPRIALTEGSGNLAFEGLVLTGSDAGPTFDIGFGVQNVTLARSRVAANSQDAIVLAAGSSHVTIAANHIHTGKLGSGVAFASTSTIPGSPPGATDQPPIVDVAIRANHFDGIAIDAIRPANFVRLLIEGNEIEGVIEHGQHADAVQTVFGGRDLVVRDNFIHDNRAQGIFFNDGRITNAVIEGNVIVRNRAEIALQLFDTVGLKIANNTIWNNEANVALRKGIRDAVVTDNLIQDIVVEDPADAARTVRQDHNLIGGGWNWGARGDHDVTGTPTFVNPAGEDYRLAARSAGRANGACALARAMPGCAAAGS
jgi:hypothetical protein